MALNLIGVLPVSGLQVGMVAGIPVLQAEVNQLSLDISNLGIALAAQGLIEVNLPDLSALTAGVSALISALPSIVIPANILTGAFNANADLAVQLGLVEIELALVGTLTANFQAGLDAGALSLWTYSGSAAGFGGKLAEQTRSGYPGVEANTVVEAIVIATEDFDSWGSFSATFNTGDTAAAPANPTVNDLRFQGTLRGAQLDTGMLSLSLPINLYLDLLRGLKATLEAQLEVSLGLNLPSVDALVDFAVGLDLSLLLENMLNINANLALEIGNIQARIDILLKLILELDLVLNAGGLSVWKYSGPASRLGSELRDELRQGIPGGVGGAGAGAYGVVVSCAVPSAFAAFGLIFGP